MPDLKMTLVDNDYKIQARADLDAEGDKMGAFSDFLSRIREELVTGQTAYLEIEDEREKGIRLSVALP